MKNGKRHHEFRDETRSRLRLLTTLLTGYGTAIIAGTALQSYLMSGKAIVFPQIFGVAAGLAFHAIAIYIQPKGDVNVPRP